MADILIVDDDVDLADTVSDVLVLAGHDVRIANDGQEGLALLDARLPDLVVLDIEMPRLDGPGMACAMLVEDCGKERIPIVMVSGFLDLPAVAESVGTPYTLAKPCSPQRLLDLVGMALVERRAPRPPEGP